MLRTMVNEKCVRSVTYETRPKVKSQSNPNAHSSERGEVVCSPKQHNARVAVIALHPGCASRELVFSRNRLCSAYSKSQKSIRPFFDFRRLHVKKRLKWFTLIRTRASAVSEEKWFVRPSSAMLASLSSLHFIPAAHHMSSFSFDF